MPASDVDDSPQGKQSNLVQTTITAEFFNSNVNGKPTIARPATQETVDSQDAPVKEITQEIPRIDLHTERRSHLSRPIPSLSRTARSSLLSQTAAETKALLPAILEVTPNAPPHGFRYGETNLFPLKSTNCPHLPNTAIRVLNTDTIDAALSLSSKLPDVKPVLILNMADAHRGGGGWLHGAFAQEEALCYRSSLSFTLKNRFYPIPEAGGIYSPTVVVIRENMASGHALLDRSRPQDLPVLSVVSVAAINRPKTWKDDAGKEKYKAGDREIMKEKMRVVLRIAAGNRHRVLVLGAFGCGAFVNPRLEVVDCWKEVFDEAEFNAGWWDTVVFAVMEPNEDKDGNENFGVFWRGLNGVMV